MDVSHWRMVIATATKNQVVRLDESNLLGDCKEVLKTVEDECVDLTCTSPPYYNARAYSIWPTYDEYFAVPH